MFKNFLAVAYRNMLREKGYAAINILGLSLGMSIAILIGLWIHDELSFNDYHSNHEKVARLVSTQTFAGETSTYPSIVVPLEQELRVKFKDDFERLSLMSVNNFILANGEKKLIQDGLWAQPDFPAILSLRMLSGNYENFRDPSTLLLSASVARSLFGEANPIGQTIKINNDAMMQVGGVFEDLPLNSEFAQSKIILPWHNKINWWNTQTSDWSNHGSHMIVQLHEPVNFERTSQKIRKITQEHGYTASNELISLHPMDRWHLYNEFSPTGASMGGRIKMVWMFGIIGVFILLLACINFMNLATARSSKRAKEVGIRKSIGSSQGQLIGQFLSESLFMALFAAVLAILLVLLCIPVFNKLSEKTISFPWNSISFWALLFAFTCLTGLISGSYPSFYLSAFQPIKVLKGQFVQGRYASLPRKILVVGQFTISVMLIIGTLVVYRQIEFAKNRPVGYDRRGIISIPMNTPELWKNYNTLREEVINGGGALNMAQSNSTVTMIWANNNGMQWAGKDPGSDPIFGTIAVSHDFGATVGWHVLQGRDFSRQFNDSGAYILNEAAAKVMGFKDPIGQIVRWNNHDHKIIGVVQNMVMESPYNPPVPSIFILDPYWAGHITVRLNPGLPIQSSLSKVEASFKKINPGSPFNFKFADTEFGKKFSDEERIGKLVNIFAILAIFISCLGLYGLVSFISEQRTKEIGIRKVLGASVFSVWGLISKDFMWLIAIACGIAMPLAGWFLVRWLSNYTYNVGLEWTVFVLAAVGALMVTLITVSFRSISAARMNPISSLHSE